MCSGPKRTMVWSMIFSADNESGRQRTDGRAQRGRRGSKAATAAPELIRVRSWLASVDPALGWLVHAFSTRRGGRTKIYRPGAAQDDFDLNLGFTEADRPEIVLINRKLFLGELCGEGEELSLVTIRQIHSSLVRRVRRRSGSVEPAVLRGDGLMTDTPGMLLGIQTADCLPVLLADRKNRAVAVFHAGWRGTLARIVENGVGRMRLEFGSEPKNLIAAIGPGIGQCCYAVGEEVSDQFESQFAYAPELFREVFDQDPVKQKYPMLFMTARAPGHSDWGPSLHLDLAEANRRQLMDSGLDAAAISIIGECTSCRTERFFSHRKEQGFTGRMMSVIGIRP